MSFTITIDDDQRCSQCRKRGVVNKTGKCLKCLTPVLVRNLRKKEKELR